MGIRSALQVLLEDSAFATQQFYSINLSQKTHKSYPLKSIKWEINVIKPGWFKTENIAYETLDFSSTAGSHPGWAMLLWGDNVNLVFNSSHTNIVYDHYIKSNGDTTNSVGVSLLVTALSNYQE